MSAITQSFNPTMPSRDQRIFLMIAGIFIGTLCTINFMNITRLLSVDIQLLSHSITLAIPIGILPYPLTFLCTDIVSECYGKTAANQLVTAGLIANLTTLVVMWLCGLPVPLIPLDALSGYESHFYLARYLVIVSIVSSMIAYLTAQYLDVFLFHTIKRLTKDKHLWLRNNVSTLISQWVDTCMVLTGTYLLTQFIPEDNPELKMQQHSLLAVIISCYGYKFIAALLDTIPCYFFVWLIKHLRTKDQPA